MGSKWKYHSEREFPFFKTPLWLFQLAYSVKCRWTHRSHLYNYACHGRTVFQFPTNSYHMFSVELVCKGVLMHLPRQEKAGCVIASETVLAMPYWWAPRRAKQLSMAAIAQVICLCACVQYWPTTELVHVLQCFLCIELIRSVQCNYPSTVRERKVLHLFALSTKQ